MRPIISSIVLVLVFLHSITQETQAQANLELLLLHNNDMHARFEETSEISGTCKNGTAKCFGGFARTAHEIRRYRKLAEEGKGRKVLYLNAGDTYTGTSWFSVHKAKIAADFMNLLKPDVMCLGNHEFDLGVDGLAPFIKASNFPIVSANLDFKKEPSLNNVLKSKILTIDGQSIGVVGHLITDTAIISSTRDVIFNDVIESVRKETIELDKAGVKIIIILGHSGYETDKKIAEEVPLADVVIGGHTNTFLWNGPKPNLEEPVDKYPKIITQKSGKKVPVVQAYAYTKYLGRLNVTFNPDGDLVDFSGQPELLDSSIPQDKDVLDLLDVYRKGVAELNDKVIGQTRVILESTADNKCRNFECNFGNMIADAFVYFMAIQSVGPGWTDYPIGIINGGSIRTSIEPGNITKGELISALPFESQIIGITMNGSDLIQSIELGVRSNGETSKGEFLQFSGLHVIYNMSKPAGERVVSALARCGDCKIPSYSPVKPEKNYNIIVTSFLAGGGDGHTAIKRNSQNGNVQDLIDTDIVESYLRKKSPVYPEEQGRISFVKELLKPQGQATSATGPRQTVLSIFLISLIFSISLI